MLVILEGPDCAGKTTLAEKLVAALGERYPDDRVTLLKAGPPTAHPVDEYEGPLLTYRPGERWHVVCDRWHVGERVYPAILGRPSAMTPGTWAHVELFLASRGAFVVHVAASLETLLDRYRVRGDDLVDELQLAGARTAFYEVLDGESRLPRVTVTGEPTAAPRGAVVAPDRLDLLLGYAESHAAAARPLARFVTYVGPPRPALLLLGDVRGGDPRDHGLWPAFGTRPGSSGAYLFEALAAESALRPSYGVANARDVDDPGALWEALHRPAAVALGANAHRRLVADGVPHRTAPHPQYVRRFHHARRAEYAADVLFNATADWGPTWS